MPARGTKLIGWSLDYVVTGPGRKRTLYGLAWDPCRWTIAQLQIARAHVKLWANDYHGKPNRVRLVARRPIWSRREASAPKSADRKEPR